MAGEDEASVEQGRSLLSKLNHLLDADPLIDELGFVHPSEIKRLKSEQAVAPSSGLCFPPKNSLSAYNAEEFVHENSEGKNICKEDDAFWCNDHKLAISVPFLGPIYKAAKECLSDCKKAMLGTGENMEENERGQVWQKIMRCTRALVLINSDYASAWNARKMILLIGSEDDLMAELRLTKLALSCAPKSEEAWAQRRWVIGRLKDYHTNLEAVLEGDSKLVELITQRSLLNYRAWRHRCWLISHMSLTQVAVELRRSKLWAASCVADNCCFHYRRCLLLHLLRFHWLNSDHCMKGAAIIQKNSGQPAIFSAESKMVADLWKEELHWSADLVKSHLGRETLWMHRRFLICHFLEHKSINCCSSFSDSDSERSVGQLSVDTRIFPKECSLIQSEFELVDFCLSACENSHPDEAERQRELAITYKLWILAFEHRCLYLSGSPKLETYVQEMQGINSLLKVLCPQKQNLWGGLIPALLEPVSNASM